MYALSLGSSHWAKRRAYSQPARATNPPSSSPHAPDFFCVRIPPGSSTLCARYHPADHIASSYMHVSSLYVDFVGGNERRVDERLPDTPAELLRARLLALWA